MAEVERHLRKLSSSTTLLRAGSAGGCPGLWAVRFWISVRREFSKTLWTIYFHIWTLFTASWPLVGYSWLTNSLASIVVVSISQSEKQRCCWPLPQCSWGWSSWDCRFQGGCSHSFPDHSDALQASDLLLLWEHLGGHSLPQMTFPGRSRHPGVSQRVPRRPLTVSVKVPRRHIGSQCGAQKPLPELWCLPAVLWGSVGLEESSCCHAMFFWEKKKSYEHQGKLTTNRGRQIVLLQTVKHTSKNTFIGLISPWDFWECLRILIYECVVVSKTSENFSLWKAKIRLSHTVAGTVNSHSHCE